MNKDSIVFNEFGRPADVLSLEKMPLTVPKKDEIVVKIHLSPINPSDLIPVSGAYRHRIELPGVPGYEGIGIVTQTGDGVPDALLGRRVLPLRGEGTWQTFVTTKAAHAVLVPDDIDDVTAACMYINPVTAWVICTETLKLSEGDVLAVNACSSFIGRIFAQLSRILKFTLIALVRDDKYKETLTSLGASYVLNTSTENVNETICEVTNRSGADAVIDCVGGEDGTELAFSLKPDGRFLSLGLLSGHQVDWQRLYSEGIEVSLFHLRHWNKDITVEKWQRTFKILISLVSEGKLDLKNTDKIFDAAEVSQVLQYIEKRENRGKVFLSFS
ncbi:zinc-dependent alcohol dehydrogenase family protein [Corticicoccus populi]|uniref:Zinc-dependent alcohol dehydrogenase family protein n=1 Tax=Corticicoccus populi TaxID=1812821 RepID=A0ABW5WT02_9STAP